MIDGGIDVESSKAQQVGTLAHALILEGNADFVTAPATYPIDDPNGKKWNRNAQYCKDWEAIQTDTVVSSIQANTLGAAQAAIKSHPLTSKLFSEGKPEVSLYATCPRTGLLLRCRIDWLKRDSIVDLKTASDASTGGFRRAMATYQYQNQAAFYKYVAELCGLEIGDFYFVALELEPIPMPNVVLLSEADLEIATASLHKTLRELVECKANNRWPGYCDDKPNYVTLPDYAHGYQEETLTGAIEL